MIPASYHTFFADAAEVAGTLIGLLFVAVSLSPEKLSGDEFDFQVRSGVAFAALTNALIISLIALIPQSDVGTAGVILAIGGISSATGLGVVSLRHASVGRRLRSLWRVNALLAVFVVQLVGSLELGSRPNASGPVDLEAYLIVGSFAFAIERAWELVGAGDTGLLTMFARSVVEHRKASAAPEGEEDGTDG